MLHPSAFNFTEHALTRHYKWPLQMLVVATVSHALRPFLARFARIPTQTLQTQRQEKKKREEEREEGEEKDEDK